MSYKHNKKQFLDSRTFTTSHRQTIDISFATQTFSNISYMNV